MREKGHLVLYTADHFSFSISKHMLPYWSTLGWKQGVLKVTTGASYGYDVGNLNESLKVSPSKTVPVPPVIVPVQWKMLSPSGKAEMPESPPIMSDMSSDCSLRWLADRALRCASGGGVRGQSTGGVRRGRGGGGVGGAEGGATRELVGGGWGCVSSVRMLRAPTPSRPAAEAPAPSHGWVGCLCSTGGVLCGGGAHRLLTDWPDAVGAADPALVLATPIVSRSFVLIVEKGQLEAGPNPLCTGEES